MADSNISDLYSSNPADAKANLRFHCVDPDETVAGTRSKAITFETLMDSLVTNNGEIVVNDGNVVIGA